MNFLPQSSKNNNCQQKQMIGSPSALLFMIEHICQENKSAQSKFNFWRFWTAWLWFIAFNPHAALANLPANSLPNSNPATPTSLSSCQNLAFGDFIPNQAPYTTVNNNDRYSIDTVWTATAADGTTATLRTVQINDNGTQEIDTTGNDANVFFTDFTDTGRTGSRSPKLLFQEGEPGDSWDLEIVYSRPIGNARLLAGDIDSQQSGSSDRPLQFIDIIKVEGFLNNTSITPSNGYAGSILEQNLQGNVYTFQDQGSIGPNPADSDIRNRAVVDYENVYVDQIKINYGLGASLAGGAAQATFMTSGMSAGCNLSGNVFEDSSNNDLFESEETLINDVAVSIYLDDGNGIFETNGNDLLIETQDTQSGAYEFTNLAENENYWVRVDSNDSDLDGYSYGGGNAVANQTNPRLISLATANISNINFPFDPTLNNPDYTQDCNSTINIALVLDASGSIANGGGVQGMRDGVKSFIDEIANNAPGTQVGIVEFGWDADTPIPFTAVNPTTVANIFDPYIDVDNNFTAAVEYYDGRHDIWTNWEAAMIQVNNNLSNANAVIFVTDGNPNKYVDDNGNLQPADYNTLVDASRGVIETVPWTDLIKSRGTHIYGFGINNGVNQNNFKPITENSNNFEIYNNNNGNAETADYAFVSAFSNFANELTFLIQDICQLGDDPNLALVKRITAINSGSPQEQDFSNYYVDVTTGINAADDNNSKWPGTEISPNEGVDPVKDYLSGETDGVTAIPGDEIEYTIYFLSNGNNTAETVLVCDLIPENTKLMTNAFGNETAASGGLSGADRAILWQYNGVTESLTNDDDGDAGYYFAPGVEPSTVFPGGIDSPDVQCGDPAQPNTNGAIVVDLDRLPRASLPADPTNSYGFIRFWVQID